MAIVRTQGIDVSHHNGSVDWNKVAAAGVQFAFAKASQGADASKPWYNDATFGTNWHGMKDAGIIRGAYHFVGLPLVTTPKANWNDDIHRQIDHFLTNIGPLEDADLPPVLDLEDGDSPERWRSLIATDRKGALSIVRELITYTKQQTGGINPILYTGSFWWSELGDPDPVRDDMRFGDCVLWFAQYPRVHMPIPLPGSPGATDSGEASSFAEYAASPSLASGQPKHIPKTWGAPTTPRWNIWQFTAFGTLPPAVRGFVDLNVFNGSLEELKKCRIGG